MGRRQRKKAAKAKKAEARKAAAKPPNKVVQGSKIVARQTGTIVAAAYFPHFLRIHLRYMRHNFRTWAALFVAPFLAIKLALIALFNRLSDGQSGVWKFDLLAILLVALCFFLAERNRDFRRAYVNIAPAVMGLGLLYWASGTIGFLTPGFLVLTILIIVFTKTVWKFTTERGYEQLSDGGDRNFVKGREFYMAGDYEQALPHLKKAAKHNHFKSLFLLGEAYENGHFVEPNVVKAAGCYFKASQKGYEPAAKRYQEILGSLSCEQKAEAESLWFQI